MNYSNTYRKIANCSLMIAVLVLLIVACKNDPTKTDNNKENVQTTLVNVEGHSQDSTIYGEAGDFGMSTFTLITDGGDTLCLSRTDSEGRYGQIYGSLRPGNRYALVTAEGGEVLSIVINVTQLEKFTKAYSIRNGHLVLHPDTTTDTVHIVTLNDSVFKYLTVAKEEQLILLPEDSTSITHFK